MGYILFVTIEKGEDTLRMILNDGLPKMWLNGKKTDWYQLTVGMSIMEIDKLSKHIMELYIVGEQLCKN